MHSASIILIISITLTYLTFFISLETYAITYSIHTDYVAYIESPSGLHEFTHEEHKNCGTIKEISTVTVDLKRRIFVGQVVLYDQDVSNLTVTSKYFDTNGTVELKCNKTKDLNTVAVFKCLNIVRILTFQGVVRCKGFQIFGYDTYYDNYLGCYDQPQKYKSLSGHKNMLLDFNECRNYCFDSKQAYFGINKKECICLNALGTLQEKSLVECFQPCSHFTLRRCGDIPYFSIYTTRSERFYEQSKLTIDCLLGSKNCKSCEEGRTGLNCEIINCSINNGNCGEEKCQTDIINLNYSIAICRCRQGFSFDKRGQCEDIDECWYDDNLCGKESGTCLNDIGNYRCKCFNGYQSIDNKPCEDINECIYMEACDWVKSNCINVKGSYKCACYPGYDNVNDFLCVDEMVCEFDHDCDKLTSMCELDKSLRHKCVCRTGFDMSEKSTCMDVDECSTDACDKSVSVCQNEFGFYQCSCLTGYTQLDIKTCKDINECDGSNLCDETSTMCVNLIGTYNCTCRLGFASYKQGKCTDIDECNMWNNDCGSYSTCVNTIGSYLCICEIGMVRLAYPYSVECQDIDECKIDNNCPAGESVCLNVFHGYVCLCLWGYVNVDGFSCKEALITMSTLEDEDQIPQDYTLFPPSLSFDIFIIPVVSVLTLVAILIMALAIYSRVAIIKNKSPSTSS